MEIEIQTPLRDDQEYFLERVTPGRHEWLDLEVGLSIGCLVTRHGDLIDPAPSYVQKDVYLEDGPPTPDRLRSYLAGLLEEGYRVRATSGREAWVEALERPQSQASRYLALQRQTEDQLPVGSRPHWEVIKASLREFGGERTVHAILSRALLRDWMYEESARLGRGRVAPVVVEMADEPQFPWGNCYLLARKRPNLVVVTGWALWEECWGTHAWCWDDVAEQIVETSPERDLYWGHRLSLEEALTYANGFSDL